jgi:hypothetical protein
MAGTRVFTAGLLLAGALVLALSDGPARRASACTYVPAGHTPEAAWTSDAALLGVALGPGSEADSVRVEVERWLHEPPDAPSALDIVVNSYVCSGPNALEAGHRYLLFPRQLAPRRLKNAWSASPWHAYELRDGRLAEVVWEAAGREHVYPAPDLRGLELAAALGLLEPYLSLRRAVEQGSTPVARESALRTLVRRPFARRGGETLADVAAVYQRAFIGRVESSEVSWGNGSPRSVHRIAVERWAWNPPDDPPTTIPVAQQGLYTGNWAVTIPGDPTLLPGERYLFFSGLGRHAPADTPPVGRFRLIGGILHPADPAWIGLPITDRFAGMTEGEAVAELQRCLDLTPSPRPGGRATVRDVCGPRAGTRRPGSLSESRTS